MLGGEEEQDDVVKDPRIGIVFESFVYDGFTLLFSDTKINVI